MRRAAPSGVGVSVLLPYRATPWQAGSRLARRGVLYCVTPRTCKRSPSWWWVEPKRCPALRGSAAGAGGVWRAPRSCASRAGRVADPVYAPKRRTGLVLGAASGLVRVRRAATCAAPSAGTSARRAAGRRPSAGAADARARPRWCARGPSELQSPPRRRAGEEVGLGGRDRRRRHPINRSPRPRRCTRAPWTFPTLSGLALRARSPARTPLRRHAARRSRHGGGRGRPCVPGRATADRGRRRGGGQLFRHEQLDADAQRQARRRSLAVQSFRARRRKTLECSTPPLRARAADALLRLAAGAERVIAVDRGRKAPTASSAASALRSTPCTPVHIGTTTCLCTGAGPRGTSIRHARLGNPRHVCWQLRVRVLLPPQYATHMNVHARRGMNGVAAPGVPDRSARPPSVSRARGDGRGKWDNEYIVDGVCGLALRHDAAEAPRGAAPGGRTTSAPTRFALELPKVDDRTATTWRSGRRSRARAELKPLSNTWSWAYRSATRTRRQHARARAWGLMLFYVYETSRVADGDPTSAASLFSPMPPMVSENGTSTRSPSSRKTRMSASTRLDSPSRTPTRRATATTRRKTSSTSRSRPGRSGRGYTADDRRRSTSASKKIDAGLPQWVPLDAGVPHDPRRDSGGIDLQPAPGCRRSTS